MVKSCSKCGEEGHVFKNCTSDRTFSCPCENVKMPHATAASCKKLALSRSKAELTRPSVAEFARSKTDLSGGVEGNVFTCACAVNVVPRHVNKAGCQKLARRLANTGTDLSGGVEGNDFTCACAANVLKRHSNLAGCKKLASSLARRLANTGNCGACGKEHLSDGRIFCQLCKQCHKGKFL